MALIEIDGLPITNGGSFHDYVNFEHQIISNLHGARDDFRGSLVGKE